LTSIYGYEQKELSEDMVKDMKYMVEEEKLAGDVYEYLDELWSLRIFKNISQSEQRHMEMMEILLNTNNILHKLSDKRSVFFNNGLQKMYNNLIKKGSKSIKDALQSPKSFTCI
jgi:hypothetical protein